MRAQLTVCLAICLIVIFALPLLAADKPAMLNVKEGLWETTTTRSMTGMPDPSDMLAQLPPEQRAKVEEMMKQKGMSMNGKTTVTKSCVTKEKIEKGMAFGENKENCTRQFVSSTPTHVEVKFHCDESNRTDGGKTAIDGTVNVDVVSSDTTKGSIHSVTNNAGHPMTMDMSFTSKYLGASCGDIK
jgi:hypothetical protein